MISRNEVATRKVLVALTTRGNYAKMKSTMQAILADPRLDLQVAVGGGLVLDRYGRFEPILAHDGFTIDGVFDYIDEGDTLHAMARSASRCAGVFADTLAALRPEVVVIIADRYEALAQAQAAVCMNVPIAHVEGGEVSGSIDERIRHAVTKLAHIHFVANKDAAARVCRMGEHPESVHIVGYVCGQDVAKGGPCELTLSQADIVEALREPVSQIVEAVCASLEQVQPEIAADIIDRGITLTGGGSLLRNFNTVLADETGLPVKVADEPLHCVAIGAGRVLEDPEFRGALCLT